MTAEAQSMWTCYRFDDFKEMLARMIADPAPSRYSSCVRSPRSAARAGSSAATKSIRGV
jgi:hypothetical protein